ncbi:jg25502 [Pararge aegeria aegeria]|uniref:Jg25502 protein n=1 Tax=Pararge aegeria aegeria TaxID=348720 RepID=A0A8S4S6K0_9NEOP|nr:jg25502 [Pararge aegeria aegeria]
MITCQGYAAHSPFPDSDKCLPVELPKSSTKNMIRISNGYKGMCISKDGIEGYKLCKGTCDSGHKINVETKETEPYCNCCRMEHSEKIPVSLTCDDNDVITHHVFSHVLCSCRSCNEINSEGNTLIFM